MTTLCRCDWIEAQAEHELQLAQIDLLKLPTSSFEKMTANRAPIFKGIDSRLSSSAWNENE